MARKIIDLSIAIESKIPSDPKPMIPKIKYWNHKWGFWQMKLFFRSLKKSQLPKGLGWASETVKLATHSGTHLDAPYHYHPTMDNGKRALTIDEVPLDWCFQDGVVLDFSHMADGDRITAEDVKRGLSKINYTLNPLDIVLIRTGADKYWGTSDYLVKGAGMTRESTLFLLDQGVKVVGIDAWSWDRPLPFLAKEFKATNDPSVVWEAHFAGIEKGYCHLEKLTNLDRIPTPTGFKVACFPTKIKAASAGWTRAVAIVEE